MNLFTKIWRSIGRVWGLLTVSLFVLAIFSLHHPFIEKLDGEMFAVDARFVAKPDAVDDVAVIILPNVYSQNSLQGDNRLLLEVLKEVSKKSPLAISLVQNISEQKHLNAINTHKYFEDLVRAINKLPKAKRKEFLKINKISDQKLFSDNTLINAIKNKKLFLAQKVSNSARLQISKEMALKSKSTSSQDANWLSWLKMRILPAVSEFGDSKVLSLGYNTLPVTSDVTETPYRSLLWSINKSLYPDMLTLLHSKLTSSGLPVWETGYGLDSKIDFRTTDWGGRVLPRYSVFTGIKADYEDIPYFDVLNKVVGNKLKGKVVIIGYESDPVVQDIALSLISLYSGSVYFSPVWTDILVIVLLFVLLIYCLFILPKMQVGVGLLLSLFILFALLVGQMGLLLVQSIWAPMMIVVLFLISAHILSLVRRKVIQRVENLEKQVFEAFWMLGVYQFEQGEYDQSFVSLQKCPTTDPMLEQMYRIGQAYEKRRQYGKALDLYRELHSRRPGYKAADKRIKSLVQLEENQGSAISNFSSARTLIVTNHGLQKPILGRYELVRELGRGAMGVVYLGMDPKINRQVAVKTMDLTQYNDDELQIVRERFFKEAETAGRLNHPNIVTIYDVGDEQDLAFIAMDYVIGQVMSDFIRKGRLLPIDMVFKLMRQVAIALDYAHKQGVVHRDIKPSNIMYNTEEHIIKVTDFGIARAAGASNTHTSSILGSPLYMAPEQLSGVEVDGRADLFSLGVSMYQLLTGELPFQGDTLASLAYQVTNVKHQPIREHRSELPILTTRLINKLLQKDPDKRFSSGKEVAAAIIKVLSTMEPTAKKGRKPAVKK